MENPVLEELQHEVDFYRHNQSEVEQEIRTLILDNQKLSKQVGMLLKEKLDNAQKIQDNVQAGELEDFKRQVTLLTKERDSLHVLWQSSQKTIDALETELRTYQGNDRGNQTYDYETRRDVELKLQTALTDYIELETKYKELQKKCSCIETKNKDLHKDIELYKERGKELENKIEELKKSLEEYKIDLEAEKKNNVDLNNQLAMSKKESVDLIKKEAEAKNKVGEALQLYDMVAGQKSEAYKKISEITEELMQVKHSLTNVNREIDERYKKELDEIREKYNEKITDMLQHIRNLDAELVDKGLLLGKTLRENKILQVASESFIQKQKENLAALDPKLTLAEQRLETVFQELIESERRNMQLVCEKQSLIMDIQRIQDIHTREIKRRDWEENLLKNRNDEQKMKIESVQKSLEETHAIVNKLQNMLTSRTELNQKMIATKEEELVELNKHLENQIELSKKWKDSYLEMSEKLKKSIAELEKENKELRFKFNLHYIGSSNLNSSVSS